MQKSWSKLLGNLLLMNLLKTMSFNVFWIFKCNVVHIQLNVLITSIWNIFKYLTFSCVHKWPRYMVKMQVWFSESGYTVVKWNFVTLTSLQALPVLWGLKGLHLSSKNTVCHSLLQGIACTRILDWSVTSGGNLSACWRTWPHLNWTFKSHCLYFKINEDVKPWLDDVECVGLNLN